MNDLLLRSLVRLQRLSEHKATLGKAIDDEVVRAHEAGGTNRQIGEAAGISHETVRRMLRQRESEDA